MCFVFVWEQTATCATYSINWLVFINEMKSVYCAVRTGSLKKAVLRLVFKGLSILEIQCSNTEILLNLPPHQRSLPVDSLIACNLAQSPAGTYFPWWRQASVLLHFNIHKRTVINPYPTAFPYGNGMVLHFYQQQESSTTKTVHKVINKGLKAYV